MGAQPGAGRAFIPIDWKKVDQLLMAGCSGIEIAAQLGIHRDTLYDRCTNEYKIYWSEYSANLKAKGDSLLRVKQFETALSGNVTMQVWLGKNRLDQRDTPEKVVITEEAAKQFNALMDQFSSLQKKEEKPADTSVDENI